MELDDFLPEDFDRYQVDIDRSTRDLYVIDTETGTRELFAKFESPVFKAVVRQVVISSPPEQVLKKLALGNLLEKFQLDGEPK